MRRAAIFVGLLTVVIITALIVFHRQPSPPRPQGTNVSSYLSGGDTAGFDRVYGPRPFIYPQDHGPHRAYRTEWWYFTGNVENTRHHFGYQLTIFRIGLRPHPIARASAWASDEIYMAHFAVTDVAGGHFYHFERFSRQALGLAGAQVNPFRIWLGDWDIESADDAFLPLRIQARNEGIAVNLTLGNDKPVVPEGDRGFSPKSSEPGNASYYYSLTRMPTAGRIRIGPQTYDVTGLSWMDHEWSTSALARDEVGWDWFYVQLDDDRELMFYRLRRRDGSTDPASAGTLVGADGIGQRLDANDVHLTALGQWHSPISGINYPSGWRIQVPKAEFTLTLEPYLKDQELDKPVVYWEGAVNARGSAHGRVVRGSGYVELTGYGNRRNGEK